MRQQRSSVPEPIAYFNGDFVPLSQAKLDPFDRGVLMSDSVFDATRTFDGRLFRMRDHLERLFRSFQFMRMDPGLNIEECAEIWEEVTRLNEPLRGSGDFQVRQFVTRGKSALLGQQGNVSETMTPTVIVTALNIDFTRYAANYDTGAHVVFPSTRAYHTTSVEPKVKTYNRMNFVMAQLEAEDIDPNSWPVLLDQSGNIAEGVGGNLFIAADGVLKTPKSSTILKGISRQVVFELAAQLGIPVVEEDLQPYDAYTADEAFLTTSTYCVLPVSPIDKRHLRAAVPGPISQRLLAAWSEMVGVDIVGQAQQ